MKIWSSEGKLIRHYRNLSDTDITTLCLDDRERKFIIGDHEGNIRVYGYMNGVEMKEFAYAEFEDRCVDSFCPDVLGDEPC